MCSRTNNIPKWSDGPRANKKQNDDEPTMKTTMVCDRGRDCFMTWVHGLMVHGFIGWWVHGFPHNTNPQWGDGPRANKNKTTINQRWTTMVSNRSRDRFLAPRSCDGLIPWSKKRFYLRLACVWDDLILRKLYHDGNRQFCNGISLSCLSRHLILEIFKLTLCSFTQFAEKYPVSALAWEAALWNARSITIEFLLPENCIL